MELYNTCARLIERGKTNGMQRKLDIFFANDRLTEEEYEKLCTQLGLGLEIASREGEGTQVSIIFPRGRFHLAGEC